MMTNMTLAAIVGVCLVTALPPAGFMAVPAATAVQQDSGASSSPPPSSAQSSTPEAQKESHGATAPSQSKTTSKRKTAASNKKTTRRKKTAASHAPAGPPKVVIKNGGATDPLITIAPSLNQQLASSQKQSADQLLASADANLKKASGRTLNANQQDMVKQIQQYMEQAKAAGDAGDLDRQHNLAVKAQLLSEELVKP